MIDQINGVNGRHNLKLPENTYWNLKKVCLERNISMMELLAELVDTYIQNNKQLLERGIITK
jgi:predicted DNA-binding ribbon-helix-helix protein